jgi:NAD(P)-dependent dehydrogenase (short-subunit alcohol dehydrogenase family)
MRLAGRIAIVTGGSSGFGRATAERFAEQGARVVIADLDEEGGAETCRRVAAAGSEAELVIGDISTLAAAQRAVERAVSRFGGLDGSSTTRASRSPITDSWSCLNTWDRVIRVICGVHACAKAAIPACSTRPWLGGERRVDRGLSPVGGSAYAATKAI